MCSLSGRYGPNWREIPDEHAGPVRRGGSLVASRGYDNPEIAAVKFSLAEDILRAVARLGTPIQAKVAVCAVRRALVARGLHHGRRAQVQVRSSSRRSAAAAPACSPPGSGTHTSSRSTPGKASCKGLFLGHSFKGRHFSPSASTILLQRHIVI